ncbi:gastrokine-2-like isoform X2 [Protopterus annectens]|uniref:gastrokine-2-like isoform X2 n=1 Tax=Protopterus annectens TaxID=7888 RepID=UPI001CFBFB4B|nr:gastrokine-2-like isoform X2 [Protopterus annectens]
MDTSSKTELTMEPPIFQQTITGLNGEKTNQTVTVNSKENVATFYSKRGNVSATIVYDYNRELFAYKGSNRDLCLVMKWDSATFPSLDEIIDGVQNAEVSNVDDDKKTTITATSTRIVDTSVLGPTIKALCGSNPIFWAEKGNGQGRSTYLCYYWLYYYKGYYYLYYICYTV